MLRFVPNHISKFEKRQVGQVGVCDFTWTVTEAVNRTAVEVTAALSKIAETEEDDEDAPAAKSAKRGSPVKKKVVSPEARKSTVQAAVAPQDEKQGLLTHPILLCLLFVKKKPLICPEGILRIPWKILFTFVHSSNLNCLSLDP